MRFLLKTPLFALLMLSIPIFGQEYSDQEAWPGMELRWQASEDYRLSTKFLGRFYHDVQDFKNLFVEPGIHRRITKGFSIYGAYRFTLRPEKQAGHWMLIDVHNKAQFGESRWNFGNRLRLHYAFDYNEVADSDYLRDRFRFGYAASKKWGVVFGGEPYVAWEEGWHLARMRYELGVNLKPMKGFNALLLYRLQEVYKEQYTQYQHIWVLAMVYDLPLAPFKEG